MDNRTTMPDVTGDELRAWMDTNGYSVRTLGRRLGVHWRTVQRWRTSEVPQSIQLALKGIMSEDAGR